MPWGRPPFLAPTVVDLAERGHLGLIERAAEGAFAEAGDELVDTGLVTAGRIARQQALQVGHRRLRRPFGGVHRAGGPVRADDQGARVREEVVADVVLGQQAARPPRRRRRCRSRTVFTYWSRVKPARRSHQRRLLLAAAAAAGIARNDGAAPGGRAATARRWARPARSPSAGSEGATGRHRRSPRTRPRPKPTTRKLTRGAFRPS